MEYGLKGNGNGSRNLVQLRIDNSGWSVNCGAPINKVWISW